MTGPADRLLDLAPADLRAFFADTPAVEVTGLIRDTTDAELRRLVADDGVRAEAVRAILERFAEFADTQRLATITGVVCFDLARERGPHERHTVRIGGGAVDLVDPSTRPDVTVDAPILDFVRLVTGQRNAALLYLADTLALDGDELLALAVGTVFVVPGTDRAAVDPMSLVDAEDVATAISGTSAGHLRDVMSGGFRSIVMDEVVRRLPDFIDLDRARKLDLHVGFRVAGRPDGAADRFLVHVDHGVCTVETAPTESSTRDTTISLDGVDFLRLVTGQLNPVKGVLTGTLKVRGDRAKALALNAVLKPPRPR